MQEVQPGIIHRDVKATNILLDEADCASIGDLGLARSMDVVQDASFSAHAACTLKGTFGYVSPEYMCTGKLPFPRLFAISQRQLDADGHAFA